MVPKDYSIIYKFLNRANNQVYTKGKQVLDAMLVLAAPNLLRRAEAR